MADIAKVYKCSGATNDKLFKQFSIISIIKYPDKSLGWIADGTIKATGI
jgi:hypothetical protein